MRLMFGDAEGLGQRKETRRLFLNEMDQAVHWKQLLGLIEPHYPIVDVAAVSPIRWQPCCASTSCSSGAL